MSEKEELLKRLSDDVFEMDDEDVVEAALDTRSVWRCLVYSL